MVAFRSIISSLILPILFAQSVQGAGLFEHQFSNRSLETRAAINGDICATLDLNLLGINVVSGLCVCAEGGVLTPSSIATINTRVRANSGVLAPVLTLVGGLTNAVTRITSEILPILLDQTTGCTYPDNANPNQCGGCGFECKSGFTLSGGQCCAAGLTGSGGACCPAGQTGCNGVCVATGTLCCASGTTASNGVCCPTGQVGCNGQCVATGTLCCASGTTASNGVCCPTGQVGCNGQCVAAGTLCCASGTTASNGVCCPSGQVGCNGQCVPSGTLCCGSGTKNCNGQCIPSASICCLTNQQACNGQCIASGLLCCATGFFACGTQCVATGVICQSGIPIFTKREINSASCPVGFEACKIPSSVRSRNLVGPAFECINTATDLESCGGCVVPLPGRPLGQDCSAIPDVDSASCQAGRCVIESCSRGFTNNGTACIETGSTGRKLSGYWAALHEATHII